MKIEVGATYRKRGRVGCVVEVLEVEGDRVIHTSDWNLDGEVDHELAVQTGRSTFESMFVFHAAAPEAADVDEDVLPPRRWGYRHGVVVGASVGGFAGILAGIVLMHLAIFYARSGS